METSVRPRRRGEFGSGWVNRRLVELASELDAGIGSERALMLDDDDGQAAGAADVETSFAGPVPAELRTLLEGLPPIVRTRFKGNVIGGRGEDCIDAIGADAMVERVRASVEGKTRRALRVVEAAGGNAGPDAELVLLLAERGGCGIDAEPAAVVENPGALPDGASFWLFGALYVVRHTGELGVSAYGVGEFGAVGFSLAGVDAIPIDAGTLAIPQPFGAIERGQAGRTAGGHGAGRRTPPKGRATHKAGGWATVTGESKRGRRWVALIPAERYPAAEYAGLLERVKEIGGWAKDGGFGVWADERAKLAELIGGVK